MEIQKTQPIDLPHYYGERSSLLDSFCEYQKNVNPQDDKNPNHWDMGLYISGWVWVNFHFVKNVHLSNED